MMFDFVKDLRMEEAASILNNIYKKAQELEKLIKPISSAGSYFLY